MHHTFATSLPSPTRLSPTQQSRLGPSKNSAKLNHGKLQKKNMRKGKPQRMTIIKTQPNTQEEMNIIKNDALLFFTYIYPHLHKVMQLFIPMPSHAYMLFL
jgi:hypothetical protein